MTSQSQPPKSAFTATLDGEVATNTGRLFRNRQSRKSLSDGSLRVNTLPEDRAHGLGEV